MCISVFIVNLLALAVLVRLCKVGRGNFVRGHFRLSITLQISLQIRLDYINCFSSSPTSLFAPPPLISLRPLQINSLFPVHRPHLVVASSKYSIIPYSSIIFRLFLHTDRLSKSYLETAYVSAVL